jgi:two-component system NtrC family sensor kinase
MSMDRDSAGSDRAQTITGLEQKLHASLAERDDLLLQRAATAEILKVINGSPGDLAPVFDKILEKATLLCGAGFSALAICKGNDMHQIVAMQGLPPSLANMFHSPVHLGPETGLGRLVRGEPFVHIADASDDEGYRLGNPVRRALVDLAGARTYLAVPIRSDDVLLGSFTIYRREVRPFAAELIALLQSFADQAAIAIQNAKLFNESKEALERQTATADILKVIASSPSDVQPVFDAIAERSNRLVGGLSTAVYSHVDETLQLMSFTRKSPEADAALQASYPRSLAALLADGGERLRKGEVVHVADVEVEWAGLPAFLKVARLRGFRSFLLVPLLRDGAVIGLISVTRTESGRFSDHHVQLLQTFADQAVIAIGNVRLFDQVQARTRELAASLEDLRSAQDRLVQTEKLASLGQLTAGIAHEIKNPLNFVNNFSALSAELTDELNDVLKPAPLADKMRQDVDELTRLLKENLIKVVQHGKRADSIVKNMLLHSREGAGEHRPADINALLDESLNLAYHGARAEKSGFNITLQREFDADAGSIELFPQEITRALLNLISNGFYAASLRKAENGETDFEPMLWASTKNLGSAVEIRIRDNGTGIPPEVKEKMFNPFFTTKPAGEGTGLGLSMSHDIIVKQHGGRIEVATEPGQFTEFTIVLPRTSQSSKRS